MGPLSKLELGKNENKRNGEELDHLFEGDYHPNHAT